MDAIAIFQAAKTQRDFDIAFEKALAMPHVFSQHKIVWRLAASLDRPDVIGSLLGQLSTPEFVDHAMKLSVGLAREMLCSEVNARVLRHTTPQATPVDEVKRL